MRCLHSLFLSLCLLTATHAMAADSLPANMSEHMITVDGVKRWYRIYKPERYKAHHPAVLLLHGGTQSMRSVLGKKAGGTNLWMDIADREGVLLIVPNGMNEKQQGDGDKQYWHDLRQATAAERSTADDVGFLTKLVDSVSTEYTIDPKRVYVTGASNGGMMTFRLLVEAPERFAAGAAFIASLPSDNPALHPPAKPTPLLIFNGKQDPMVKWEGGQVAKNRGSVMKIEDSVAWWVKANKADLEHADSITFAKGDGKDACTIRKTTYPALPGGAETVFYAAEEGGHTLPTARYVPKSKFLAGMVFGPTCRNAEGADLAWEFMKQYAKP